MARDQERGEQGSAGAPQRTCIRPGFLAQHNGLLSDFVVGTVGGGVLAGLLPEAARDKPGPLLSLGSFTELSVAADPFLTTCYRGSLPRNDRLCIRFGTGGWPHLVGFCFMHSRLAPTQTTRDLLTPYQHESKRAEAVRTRVPRVPAGAPISPSLSPE